jgi:hypothetical protein
MWQLLDLPAARMCYAQQLLPFWMGGQATVPYEQNTQQWPG